MASFAKLGNWFLTESGQSLIFGAAVATSCGIVSLHILPNTIFLDEFVNVVRYYKSGFSVPVPKPLRERFEKTLSLLETSEIHQHQFQPFMVSGFDIFSAGTFSSKYGVAIGLPINFSYIDSETIDTSTIRINNNSVPWDTDEGKLLLKSLNLSEKAQIYAIGREIELRKTRKYFMDLVAAVGSFFAAFGIVHGVNTTYNLYNKPRSLRMMLYIFFGLFGYCNYVTIKDFGQLHYEKKVDRYLRDKNPIFKEGGKDFYENIIKRNVALRKLMGKEGENKYSVLGNENYLIRQRHLPLIQRRDFFENNVDYTS